MLRNRFIFTLRSRVWIRQLSNGSFNSPTTLDFDYHYCLKNKTFYELLNDFAINKISSYDFIIDNHETIRGILSTTIGKRNFGSLIRKTMYGRFIAGSDHSEVEIIIKNLQKENIGAIIDYAAEGEDESLIEDSESETNFKVIKTQSDDLVSSIVLWGDFGKHEDNFSSCSAYESILKSIKFACSFQSSKYVSVKISALIKPSSLKRGSNYIGTLKNIFNSNSSDSGQMDMNQFFKSLNEIGISAKNDQSMIHLFKDFSQASNLIDWNSFISLLHPSKPLKTFFNKYLKDSNLLLKESDSNNILNLMLRLDKLSSYAKTKNIKLLIDAEQSYYQKLISFCCIEMMRKYNKDNFSTVYNTYQCYLKETFDVIKNDFNDSKSSRQTYKFAAKIVRGAYMVRERMLASTNGTTSPVFDTYEGTNDSYDRTFDFLIENHSKTPSDIIIATHNPSSVLRCTKLMQTYDIPPDSSSIEFAQLMGLADYLTYSLAKNYKVYKYIPYGPVELVWPYLVRRLQENRSILKFTEEETTRIVDELGHRLKLR